MALHPRISSRLRFLEYRRGWTKRKQPGGSPGAEGPVGRSRSLFQLYRELFQLLEGQRLTVAMALITLSLATLLKLVPPAATKLVIDWVLLGNDPPELLRNATWLPIPTDPKTRLTWLVVGVFVVSGFATLLGLWGRWRATLVSKRTQVRVRRKVFEHAVRLPLHRVYQLKSGGAASLLREDAGGVGELVFSMIYNPWRAVVQLLGGFLILLWVDWRLLLGATALAPTLYWTDRLWNQRLRPLYRDVRKQRQEIDAKTAEAFGGMRIVRAFGRQRTESARFNTENHFMTRQELFAWTWSRGVEILWDLLLPAASGALLLYGGRQVLDGRLSLGDLMMFLVYLTMLLEPLAVLATSVTQLQNNLSGLDRVLDLLEEPREIVSQAGTRMISKPQVSGHIRFESVSFAYPGTETLVLNNIDFEAEPGETIALVGRSGAGKTTLCNLIARFYDPTAGTVRLDGINLREIEVESYRRLLGIVEQDVFLFDGTIGENIAYADRRAARASIEQAAHAANAAEFINRLPEGYDTLIGERGVKLSGGQRQRLAIARAILADPRLFILDEATSNLDSESEYLIQQSLARLMLGRTSFVIAHRLSTILHADRILVLDQGELIETGRHDDLMATDGLYRDLARRQQLEVKH